jgi:hypothetical protein
MKHDGAEWRKFLARNFRALLRKSLKRKINKNVKRFFVVDLLGLALIL